MKLDAVKLKNFRGYKEEVVVPISNITAFIGKNDAGKSTLLEALEIFFNNSLVSCERNDLNKFADCTEIEITCIFTQLPAEIIIDSTVTTTLSNEFLLNSDEKLEVKKIFAATSAKPKEKIYIRCNHPTVNEGNDLLTLKRAELKARARVLGINQNSYNSNENSTIRRAIWDNFEDLETNTVDLLVDKEDTKKVYEALSKYFPLFALFQSDRKSNDDDKEVVDPMKIAIQQALKELEVEIDYIKDEVRKKAIETANRTLEKLREMSPELADQLIPEFKSEPKFDSQFKLTINSEDDIPINKRGSGVRRLILLNFFRAEAERIRLESDKNQILFAFEEPETSQHPNHQEMLIKSFIDLANSADTQILLTTHTPALAALLPLESLRFIEKVNDVRIIQSGTEEVFEKIAQSLGILPDPISKHTRALLLVEGKGDVVFINHIAEKLKENNVITHTFAEKRFAIVPVGGCGNLKHWKTLKIANQFNIPYCILLDSDRGTNEEYINAATISSLREEGIKAYVTRRREPENYIHPDCIGLVNGSYLEYSEIDDAKQIISQAKAVRKENVLEYFWTRMSFDQIREIEAYVDNGEQRFEFSEMIIDFLSLVPD